MLAEMGIRVWMPTDSAQAASPHTQQEVALQPVRSIASHGLPASTTAPNPAPVTVALPVRREPPLRLPVMDAPPTTGSAASSALAAAQYVIGNLPAEISHYDLVVLGEPCQGAAEQLLGNILKLVTSAWAVPPRIFTAQMVASHNEAVCLHDQLASLPAKLVLVMGPHAATALLGSAAEGLPFSKLRGTVHSLPALPSAAVVTYHPQQLLRQPKAKAQAWLDIKLVLRTLAASVQ
jgi:uracil-DNA glycosylase family 4